MCHTFKFNSCANDIQASAHDADEHILFSLFLRMSWRDRMYCIQFLLPVLLLPRPLNPTLLFEHSLFLGKIYINITRSTIMCFSVLRFVFIFGDKALPNLFNDFFGVSQRPMLQLPWRVFSPSFMQLWQVDRTVIVAGQPIDNYTVHRRANKNPKIVK